ncbi:MAG TPA: NAD(P)/FAD-dependent oxidoreductase [Methylomirabilota bacterium]
MGTRCDVAVVGGGPAGATVSAFLARAGLAVTCFERERFPRFHVGESLLPASMPLFERLGVRERLEAAGFQRKNGAIFAEETTGRQLTLNFRRGPRWDDHAFNVPRADFDRILLDHAAKEGAIVREGVEVRELAFHDEGVRLAVLRDTGATEDVEARFLVDASGRDALVASRLGRRVPMPDLGKAALFAHYRGARRLAGRMEGHLQAYLFDHGWFWWIPFTGDLVSVGVVLHQRALKDRRGSLEEFFEEMVAASPTVASGLAGATRVTAVHPVANFSYRTEPAVGDRFVAIGDAVVFIDPVFSTGVYVAMQSAELVAEAIVRAFRDGQFRAARFDTYRRRVEAGTALFFEFIERYYDPAFLDLFFAPRPPPTLKDALTTVFAGGAFLEQPLWLRVRLACVRLGVRVARARRRRRGLPVESQLTW